MKDLLRQATHAAWTMVDLLSRMEKEMRFPATDIEFAMQAEIERLKWELAEARGALKKIEEIMVAMTVDELKDQADEAFVIARDALGAKE
jgi:hypothetical protein